MLNRIIFFITSLSLIVLVFITQTFAQDYSGNIWNGIRFGKADTIPYLDNNMIPPSGEGGGAVAVDPITMRLLFYTDGVNVYDATHSLMPGGPLNGNPDLNQAAVVVPDPNNPGRYIIYTNTGSGIEASIVNMNNLGNASPNQVPLGSIVSANQSTGVTNSSEAMAVFATGTPLTYYLVYQNTASNELVIREIGPSGALGASITAPLTPGMTAANISLIELEDGTFKLAVSPGTNHDVELFTYNPTSNSLTSDGTVANSAGPNGIFDTEWSSDGRYLYISKNLTASEGQVYQYDTENPSDPMVAILPTPAAASFGLQRGPDNQIYHIYESAGGDLQLGRINDPDSIATVIVYDAAPLGTAPFNSKQFSSVLPAQSKPLEVEFTYTQPVCQNSTVTFFPSWDTEPAPTEFIWNFNNGDSISYAINPSYMFEEEGTFPVSLTVRRGEDVATYQQTIIVLGNELTIELGADTVICPGETLILDVGDEVAGAASIITWSDGGIHNTPTEQTIEVDTTGTYWVTATLNNGCRLYDAIQVELYGDEFQRMNYWYFGNQAGIDFNPDPNDPDNSSRPVTDGQMNAPEGTATISDTNGNLLFYTNGEQLWGVNRATGEHVLIDADIGGSPTATQSSIIIPHPGDETLYYIFTVESVGNAGTDNMINLNYTLVDIKGGVAGVVVEKNVPLFSPSGERITAVQMGEGYVLLAHEMGGNTFWAFPITEAGIGTPVLSSAGSDHSLYEPGNTEGYMQFSPDGTKVAVALSGPDNKVEIFDFDVDELTVSNPIVITFDEPYDEYQVYGIEYSGGMNKLLVSLVGNNGSVLYEIRIDSVDQEYMQDRLAEIYSGPERLGAIQRGPDGQYHVAVDGADRLGAISVREDTLGVSIFSFEGLELGGRTSTLGLPNFVRSFGLGPQEPGIMISGAQCVGSLVTFSAATTSMIDEVSWTIFRVINGTMTQIDSSTEEEFENEFADPGLYSTILHITNRCGLDTTFTEEFEIFDNPVPPTLSAVSVLCIGDDVILDAINDNRPGLDDYTYQWSTGEDTKTIAVSNLGAYNVTITDGNGCSASRETQVVDSRPTVDLGPDQTVCQFESVAELNSGVPTPLLNDFTITWQLNGNPVQPDGLANTISVNTDVPGEYTYRAEVLDLMTNCAAIDEVVIMVNIRPDLETSSDPATCGDNNGTLNIVSANPGFDYEWFDSGDNAVTDPTAVAAGVYRIVITDPASGCTHSKSQGVDNDPAGFDIATISEVPDCDGGNINFSLSGIVNAPVDVRYTIYDNNTSGVVFTQTVSLNAPFQVTTPIIPRGDYILEVEVEGCIQTEEITVVGLDETTFSVRVNSVCSPNGELEVYDWNGALPPSITWTPPSGSVSTGPRFSNLSQSGEYKVTVQVGMLCPSEAIVPLELIAPPNVSLTSEGGCDGNVSALASPENAMRYEWSINNTNIVTNTPIYSFNAPGTYPLSVTVVDQDGCSASGNITLTAYPEVLVQIASSIACEDDNPIVLTAEGNLPDLLFDWYVGANIQQTSTSYTIPREFETQEIRVVATIGTNCTGEDRISVVRRPLTPVEGLMESYVFCSLDSEFMPFEINPTNISAFQSYVWTDVSSGNEVYWNSPLQVYQSIEGQFLGTFTNEFFCVTEYPVTLADDCVPVVYVPNAFTPNGDGNNDRFVVFPRYVTHFEIFVFNRWGELVFHSDQLDFEWDGTFNGKLMPVGTYPYLMRYRSLTDPNRGVMEQRGGVLLLR